MIILDKPFSPEQIEQFGNAEPFPHLVIDGAVRDNLLHAAVDQIPYRNHPGWRKYRDRKFGFQDVLSLPAVGQIATIFLGPETQRAFRELLGVDELLADPSFEGGGIHRVDRGGRLGMHVDFNVHPHQPWTRKLNLLLYLNRDWNPAWGGNLILADASGNVCREIEPVFNRLVLFEASDRSWHGHPQSLQCPPSRSRLSLAMYFYIPGTAASPHSTVYRDEKRRAA